MAPLRLRRPHRGGQNGRAPGVGKICGIPERTQTHPTIVDEPISGTDIDPDRPWQVIVWNDPINLMSYVTYVFQKLFGYSREKAESLMLDVHHKGRAVVSSGTRERAELDVFRLHECSLWATMEQT